MLDIPLAISVTQEWNIISFNDEQNKKVKAIGILNIICFNEMQSSKVHSSFEVTEEGIAISFKNIYQF